MKKTALLLLSLLLALLAGCGANAPSAQVAATTPPVYCFTQKLLEGTDVSVTRLITEPVSCLHDYSMNIDQVRTAESAEVIVISGAGLEDFMGDILSSHKCIDASADVPLLCGHHHGHEDHDDHNHEDHDDHNHEDHDHDQDPHIWLSPENAGIMASNISRGLIAQYPQHQRQIEQNLSDLLTQLEELQAYGEETLQDLSTRELITFHDGFAYLAQAFDLTILRSIEEEHGSEASARDLSDLIAMVQEHGLPAIFTEQNGSDAAASVIARETGVKVYTLSTAMGDPDYFGLMRQNIDTLKEALK